MDNLLPADYVLCGITVVMAVTGAFRGFSGTLAFFLASLAAAFLAMFGWHQSATYTEVLWMRGAGTLVATLLTFGLVRAVVKKLVNGLLSQPSDALFGFVAGALFGVLLLAVWACTGQFLEYSHLASIASECLK